MSQDQASEKKWSSVTSPFHSFEAIGLWSWIEENKGRLRPPIGNALIYGKGCQFKVMVVGGPNVRTDYHINETEEWFYQMKGDAVLKIVDNGVFRDVVVREGQQYVLPPRVPHSPQRTANSYGLVLEMDRPSGVKDGLRWYCQNCKAVVYEEWFICEDLGTQLKTKVLQYYSDPAMRTCKGCGVVDERPTASVPLIEEAEKESQATGGLAAASPAAASSGSGSSSTGGNGSGNGGAGSVLPFVNKSTHPDPFDLAAFVKAHTPKDPSWRSVIAEKGTQWQVSVQGFEEGKTSVKVDEERWFYQLQGKTTLTLVDNGVTRDVVIAEGALFLVPANTEFKAARDKNSIALVVGAAKFA